MPSLLKFQILNGTANLEQVLHDIFTLTAVLSRFRIDHEAFLVFSEQIAESHSVVIDGFIIKEMELFKNVDEVYLTGRCHILLNDTAILLVKALDDLGLSQLFFWLFQEWFGNILNICLGREEPISIISFGTALIRTQETEITSIADTTFGNPGASRQIGPARLWSFAVLIQKLRLLEELLVLFVVLLEFVHSFIIYLFKLLLVLLIDFILNLLPCKLFIRILKFNWHLRLWRTLRHCTFSWSGLRLKLWRNWFFLIEEFVHGLLLFGSVLRLW